MKVEYLIILITLILTSCKDCEDRSEPTLSIFFADYRNYDLFYGIGGIDTLEMTYELPIAINSDTSFYIFIDSSIIDTLGISYKRLCEYKSEECGFSITLNSFKLLDISTFDSAVFNVYDHSNTILGDRNKNAYEVILYH
jgi:hypothetical protein